MAHCCIRVRVKQILFDYFEIVPTKHPKIFTMASAKENFIKMQNNGLRLNRWVRFNKLANCFEEEINGLFTMIDVNKKYLASLYDNNYNLIVDKYIGPIVFSKFSG